MKKTVRLSLIVTACLGMLACSTLLMHYGRIALNPERAALLERYTVQPEYRYYISGSGHYPNALMGLHRDYRLDPETLWKEVAIAPELLKDIVESIKTISFRYGYFPNGYDLLDDRGRPIGFWYSLAMATTLVRMQEDGTVRIDTPPLDTYTRMDPPD
jgi:hypothetical protein